MKKTYFAPLLMMLLLLTPSCLRETSQESTSSSATSAQNSSTSSSAASAQNSSTSSASSKNTTSNQRDEGKKVLGTIFGVLIIIIMLTAAVWLVVGKPWINPKEEEKSNKKYPLEEQPSKKRKRKHGPDQFNQQVINSEVKQIISEHSRELKELKSIVEQLRQERSISPSNYDYSGRNDPLTNHKYTTGYYNQAPPAPKIDPVQEAIDAFNQKNETFFTNSTNTYLVTLTESTRDGREPGANGHRIVSFEPVNSHQESAYLIIEIKGSYWLFPDFLSPYYVHYAWLDENSDIFAGQIASHEVVLDRPAKVEYREDNLWYLVQAGAIR